MTSASRNVLLLWFEQRRGLVSGMKDVFVSSVFVAAAVGDADRSMAKAMRVALMWPFRG